jgi:FKBP-type peptidyl-prolyl cis-trans isomerase FkpA
MQRLDVSPGGEKARGRAERQRHSMNRMRASALLVGVALAAFGCQQQNKAAATPSPSPATATSGMTEDQKAIYAFGAVIGQQVGEQAKQLRLTPAEMEAFKKGLEATLAGGKPDVTVEEYGPKFQALAQARAAAGAADQKQKAAGFLTQAAQEPGAVKTASGLVFKTVRPGTGRAPKPTDVVQVNYRGTLTDGTEFDASAKHGGPATFPLNRVIPCWTEGVGRMKVGEQAKIVCPSEIAYGDRGQAPTIPPGATLVFEVELLGIQPAQAAQAPPARPAPQIR